MSKPSQFKTVEDVYQLDEDEIHIRADDIPYWESVKSFYEKVKNRSLGALSNKQREWLDKIKDQLENRGD